MNLRREDILKEEVKDLVFEPGLKVYEMIEKMGQIGGFMALYLSRAAKILWEMVKDEKCFKFISFPANIIATGLRNTITTLVKIGAIDAIITTGGMLDHEIARSFGGKYYNGKFELDDELLREINIHRLGSVLIPLENYGPLIEKVTFNLLDELVNSGKNTFSPSELAFELGKRINDEKSILRQCYLKRVPIYIPGIIDSSFGTSVFFYAQTKDVKLDLFSDMKSLINIVFESKRTGGLIIGGGISKHHLLWWNQFKDGLNYSIYITTAVEYDGSLSGARPREAISWKKIKKGAKHVVVYGDATIILPLLTQYLVDKVALRDQKFK